MAIPAELGGVTLTPGVYASGTLGLTAGTTLTLDAQGNPAAVFILQAGSTLITGADTHVTLSGGAHACNVFWQVGSSATLGASSVLTGTILASTSISMVASRSTVAASAPTVNNSTSAAGTGGSLTLTPIIATAATGNPPSIGPVPAPAQTLSATPATIENAPPGTGQGEWDFNPDSGATKSLTEGHPR